MKLTSAMQGPEAEGSAVRRLRVQRNLFAALAVCALAAMGFAIPRKLASYRELRAVNQHLVQLQRDIVENQQQTRETQEQILQSQQELTRRMPK
jgi:septal ring factor EnvC (AmiA/AmiB activator)